MRRTILCLLMMALLAVGLPAWAQEMAGNVASLHFVQVKDGMQDQFEAALKKHWALNKQYNSPTPVYVWQVIAGENTGMYGVGSFGHHWADFDKPAVPDKVAQADIMANVAPTVAKHTAEFDVMLGKLSNPPSPDAPRQFDVVIVYHVKNGKGDEFQYLIGKINEAIKKADLPWHWEWYRVALGGRSGEYVLVLPHADWASFAPSQKPFDKMLEEGLGKQGAQDVMDKWDHVVAYSESQVIRERPDLSYMPAAKQ